MGGGGAASPGGGRPRPNSKTGYYGRKGKSRSSRVRHMIGDAKTAWRFFESLTKGYVKQWRDGDAIIREMPDGTYITYRSTSRDKTPVIDIHGPGDSHWKIHFVRTKTKG